MSNNGLASKDWLPQSSLLFGLRVDQTAPSNYVNPLLLYGESFHNSLSDSYFGIVPVRAISSQESEQIESLNLSHKSVASREADENSNPLPNNQNLVYPSSALTVPISIINPQPNGEQLQRNILPAGNELDFDTSAFGSGESPAINHDKACAQPEKRKVAKPARVQSEKVKASKRAYAQSEKGKAAQKAYRESEQGKARKRAWEQSRKGKATRKAYQESEQGKARKRAWEQSRKGKASSLARLQSEKRKAYLKAYHKAYYLVLKNTGDKEQAKIAGKQAGALIRESDKKNNEPDQLQFH